MSPFLAAVVFGCIAWLTMEFSRPRAASTQPDRGERLRAEGLRIALCCGAAMVGGILTAHDVAPATLLALLVLSTALGTTAYVTTSTPVSPMIPGVALIVIVATNVMTGDFGSLVSAVSLGLPFAITAFLTKNGPPNYRDTVVSALGGAVFGLQVGVVVVGCLCFGTLLARALRKRDATSPRAAGFAPILSAGLLVVLVGQLAIS